MVQQFLSSPQATALLTTVALGVLYFLVGKAGTGIEALGAQRGWPALIALGKRLEAIAFDGPKLAGKQGASETPPIVPTLILLLAIGLAYSTTACASTKPCPVSIEAQYTAELVETCRDAGSVEACGDAGKAITSKHEAAQVDAGCRVQ